MPPTPYQCLQVMLTTMALLTFGSPQPTLAHPPLEVDEGAIALAVGSSDRTPSASELDDISKEPIAAFIYLQGRMRGAAGGQRGFDCSGLPSGTMDNILVRAMNDWLSYRCQGTPAADRDRELFVKYGDYAYWATVVAHDGHPEPYFVEELRRRGYRVEAMNDDAHRLLLRSARKFESVEEAVAFWLFVCEGRDVHASAIGLVELGESIVPVLLDRFATSRGAASAPVNSNVRTCLLYAVEALGVAHRWSELDLDAGETFQLNLEHMTRAGKPGHRDWTMSVAYHVLMRSGSTSGKPPHPASSGRTAPVTASPRPRAP